MYNMVDLLTFTIGMQFLLEEKKEMHSESGFIENYFDLIVAAIAVLSCVLSGTGMTASTIIYNSASSVHEANIQAFVKSPGVNQALMYVNDASIWGFNFLCLGCTLTALKFAWSDNKVRAEKALVRDATSLQPTASISNVANTYSILTRFDVASSRRPSTLQGQSCSRYRSPTCSS